MKRNYCIDFIKIVLAIFIALGHFGVQIVSSGMVVICFFIISGYFLVRSYESGKYHEDSLKYAGKTDAYISMLRKCSSSDDTV